MDERYRMYAALAAARGRPVDEALHAEVGALVDGLFSFVGDLHAAVRPDTFPVMLYIAPEEVPGG